MASFGHSAFLQALGWATLNSFWQMGLMWCLFSMTSCIANLTSRQKYRFASIAVLGGFFWFLFTFIHYWNNPIYQSFPVKAATLSYEWIDRIITAASITYLSLLFIPAYRLLKNWQHIQKLRTQYLHKAALTYRLFVKKTAFQLGIKKTVQVYLSDLVKSPVTIGYIKPVILLPVAAMNNLTMLQVEAVLLHELSHIKRYDYLINLIITIIHTLLYFNPFSKLFIKIIDEEREKCCDELVLQFEYDKLSYASALLKLEKNAQASFLMAAAGKKHLLTRIEKIVGMERKPVFKFNQVIGIFAALLLVFLLNAVLIVGKNEQATDTDISFTQLGNPFYFPNSDEASGGDIQLKTQKARAIETMAKTESKANPGIKAKSVTPAQEVIAVDKVEHTVPFSNENIVQVKYNIADAALSNDQKEQVKQTVNATKKILTNVEWKEVEKEIADGMTSDEKQIARQQYLVEIDKINWKQLEENLKADYNSIDWNHINSKINSAMTVIKLDSLESVYSDMIEQVTRAKADVQCTLAYPDVTVDQLKHIEAEAEKRIKVIEAIRNKKIVHL